MDEMPSCSSSLLAKRQAHHCFPTAIKTASHFHIKTLKNWENVLLPDLTLRIYICIYRYLLQRRIKDEILHRVLNADVMAMCQIHSITDQCVLKE